MAQDIASLLAQFSMQPSADERKKARDMALMRMGMGILASNQPSRLPQNGLGVLAQGGMMGLDQYQSTLKDEVANRRQNTMAGLQAMQIQKEMAKTEALKGLTSAGAPQPLGPQAMSMGAEQGDIGPTVGNLARLDALEQNPVASQYTPIPLDKLTQAAGAGVDIKPFLQLNQEARPDVLTIDLGDKVRTIDKKTLRVISETPKGSAPGSKPFEAQDIDSKAYRDFLLAKGRAGATTVTVGAKEADKKFADEYTQFITGGYADTQKQLQQLQAVSDALGASKDGSLTGPLVGMLPNTLRALAFPKSQAAKDAVEEVVQRNLRLILGAQFTEKEGERLIARAYNPILGEEENKKRIDRLIGQIKEAAESKLSASRYFMEKGTLEGWKGKVWTMKDFDVDGSTPAPIDDETRRLLDKYAPRQ